MKKIILSLILIGFLTVPILSAAQIGPPETDVREVLNRIVDWLFVFLLIFAALFIVIAGFYFVTAQGDPEKVGKARNMILYAVIGIIVAFLARGIVILVESIGRGTI